MNTITKTAFANMKQNKGRNILTGIAVCLTTILIVSVFSIGFGMVELQMKAINEIYPKFHAMFHSVSIDSAKQLAEHAQAEQTGIYKDAGTGEKNGIELHYTYHDSGSVLLSKIKLEKGTVPAGEKDIAVTKKMLSSLGVKAELGDSITLPYQTFTKKGRGKEKQMTFTVCGFLSEPDTNSNTKNYGILVSKQFLEKNAGEANQGYEVVFRLKKADSMTTDQIEGTIKNIAKGFGIDASRVVFNSEYLLANYIDPSIYTGIAGIILLITLAGVLTIYSIYYVSMLNKVHEYGKLKALGATKRQVRQIVFREGMMVTAAAIPVGLIIGSVAAEIYIKNFTMNIMGSDLTQTIIQIIEKDGGIIVYPWIIAAAASISLLTSIISLSRPMSIASRISPIESMRYDGENSGKKRKGYQEMNLIHLTTSNLARNKKRTLITIFTLGITGILFMIISTVISCANPKEIARDNINYDYELTVNSESGNEQHPERDWRQMQKNNPLNETMMKSIENIKGVKVINQRLCINGRLSDTKENIMVYGAAKEEAKELERGQVKGHISYEELLKGEKVIVSKNYLQWYPEWKTGSKINLVLYDGDKEMEKTLEVAAIGDYPDFMFHNNPFILPDELLKDWSENNILYSIGINVEKEDKKEAERQLKSIVEKSGQKLNMDSYDEEVKLWEDTMGLVGEACYAIMFILGAVGMLNLVNTMIHSIYTRKKELGILRTIGMSERQILIMLQIEGLFYTAGTLLMSLGIGSIGGYGAFLYAREEGIFGIQAFHFPVLQAVILIMAVLTVQLLLTWLVNRNYRKESLIDRIRFSE